MKPLSTNALIGYPAGIITGISYGLNPLFGMPLMQQGAEVESILFFRYGTKAIRQEIVSSNPHTEVVYSEVVSFR